MQRVRMSLPYFKEMGWEPVVICVDEKYVEQGLDPLLIHSIPTDISIHKVKALPAKLTRKFGLGSLSLRSLIYFKRKGNALLKNTSFDLIYFSTTAFHVCSLGPYWQKKFNVPFIIDVQDPWRSDFYLDKPKHERPPKFLIAYNIDKFLEKKTIPKANGIISVSKGYCDTFLERYTNLREQQCKVITFGAMQEDFVIMKNHVRSSSKIKLPDNKFNFVYIGRGGFDLKYALEIIFKAHKKGLDTYPELFSKVHYTFIGTDYAAEGVGKQTILPIAKAIGVDTCVTEVPDRIPYFETLFMLKQANVLLIPGSTDTSYTASKIYPYLLVEQPLLAVFDKSSSVVQVLADMQFGNVVSFNQENTVDFYVNECMEHMLALIEENSSKAAIDMQRFEKYTAKFKTREQVDFFNDVVDQAVLNWGQKR